MSHKHPIIAITGSSGAGTSSVTRTFEARYVLEEVAANAPLGSTVTILVPDTRQAAAPRIPLSAMIDRGQGPGVWVIESTQDQTATVAWRALKIAALDDESVTLIEGLGAGDRFVTMGAHLLRAGDQVRLADSVSKSVP